MRAPPKESLQLSTGRNKLGSFTCNWPTHKQQACSKPFLESEMTMTRATRTLPVRLALWEVPWSTVAAFPLTALLFDDPGVLEDGF